MCFKKKGPAIRNQAELKTVFRQHSDKQAGLQGSSQPPTELEAGREPYRWGYGARAEQAPGRSSHAAPFLAPTGSPTPLDPPQQPPGGFSKQSETVQLPWSLSGQNTKRLCEKLEEINSTILICPYLVCPKRHNIWDMCIQKYTTTNILCHI